MNFLWTTTSPTDKQHQAENMSTSPSSLMSVARSRTRVAPKPECSTVSPRSPRSFHRAALHRTSEPTDAVFESINESTKVVPSIKKKISFDLSLPSPSSFSSLSEKLVAGIPELKKSRSLSPVTKSSAALPSESSIATPVANAPKDAQRQVGASKVADGVQDDVTDAIQALSNADSVLAKATNSFRRTFDFIAKTTVTSKDDASTSPSTTSTSPMTPPMSPSTASVSDASRAKSFKSATSVNPTRPSKNLGTASLRSHASNRSRLVNTPSGPVASADEEDFDPIMETRSFSHSAFPALPWTSSVDSLRSSAIAHHAVSLSHSEDFTEKYECKDFNKKYECKDFTKKYECASTAERPKASTAVVRADDEAPTCNDKVKTGDSSNTPDEVVAEDRDRALIRLQNSLSNLGDVLSNIALNTQREIPSLLNNGSSAVSAEGSFEPIATSKESFDPKSVNGTTITANHTELPAKGDAGCGPGEICRRENTNNLALERDPPTLKLHDSLSVLTSNAFDTAWTSYCDLPSLLQSHSSTLSFDEAPGNADRVVTNRSTAESASNAKQQGDKDYVLVGKALAEHNPASASDHGKPNLPLREETQGVLSHDEALSQMQTSLGDLFATVQTSVFGNDEEAIPDARPEARLRKALEPEERGRRQRGLEPEQQNNFGVDELFMRVANEEVTCTTDESYEVIRDIKYYPVEIENSGVKFQRPPPASGLHETSEYVTFSDEMVERHIQASFYLEEPLVDVPLNNSNALGVVLPSPSERQYLETWAALSNHSSRESAEETTAVVVAAPRFFVDNNQENPKAIAIVRSKGEDPPGQGPWPIICGAPCFAESTDGSFVFCHQSPQELGESLSSSLVELGSKVQQMDDEHHVSEKLSKSVSQVGSKLTTIWKKADRVFGVSATTKHVSTVLKETAKNPPKPEDFHRTWEESKRQLQLLDKEHRFIEQTASAVAEGAEALAQSIESLTVRKPGMLMTNAA